MKRRVALYAGLFALTLVAVGCGPNLTAVPPGPTGPTTLSALTFPRVDGVWVGDLTLTDITGGAGAAFNAGGLACAGTAFFDVLGESSSHSLFIEQTGTDLSAKLTSARTGLSCNYAGEIGSNGTVVLNADVLSCQQENLVILCPSGEVQTLSLVGASITATINAPGIGASLAGTAAHSYNVTSATGLESGLVANRTFSSLTRR